MEIRVPNATILLTSSRSVSVGSMHLCYGDKVHGGLGQRGRIANGFLASVTGLHGMEACGQEMDLPSVRFRIDTPLTLHTTSWLARNLKNSARRVNGGNRHIRLGRTQSWKYMFYSELTFLKTNMTENCKTWKKPMVLCCAWEQNFFWRLNN